MWRSPQADSAVDPGRRRGLALALEVFLANHLLLIAISLLTSKLFYDVLGRSQTLFSLWQRWDVLWYLHLANSGYSWYAPPIQSDVAFFPLYPLSIHLLTLLTPLSAYAAALLVSNACFLAALYYLHRLVLHDFDSQVAERTLYYLAFFPTALFFFTAYSESLYLLCCVGCLYALRQRRWWLAGACGMAATLTRQLGILLVVPFLYELYEQYGQAHARPPWGRLLPALALIPSGLATYMAYLQLRFGNALLFLRAESAWHRVLAPPWQGVLDDASRVVHPIGRFSAHTRGALQAQSCLNVAFVLGFLALAVVGVSLLPRAYSWYAAAVLLAVLASPTTGSSQPLAMLSVARFEVTLVPPFITMALIGRSRPADRLFLTTFTGLLVLFTIVFIRGRWIA